VEEDVPNPPKALPVEEEEPFDAPIDPPRALPVE
jgi:hypothetical protein